MNTIQTAYKILHSLETGKKADYKGTLISPQKLGVSDEEWLDVVKSLLEENYVAGIQITEDILGNTNVDIGSARITLKGAEYLHENSAMKKFAKIATDIVEIIKP